MTPKRKKQCDISPGIDALVEEIVVDASGEDEQLWAFLQAIEGNVALPADAFVIGVIPTLTLLANS